MKRKKDVLLLIESSTAYGRKLAQGVSQFVRERGDWTLHVEDRDIFSVSPQLLSGWRGDGIISRTPTGPIRSAVKRCKCPIVELLSVDTEVSIEVLPDDYQTIVLCIDHFLERGITSIGFYAYGWNWWIERRYNHFKEIVKNRKIEHYSLIDRSKKSELQPKWKECYEKPLLKWLKTLPNRTGIIAVYDPPAMRVLNGCRQLGLDVPEQIAILGIDNDEHLCNLVTPPLSSLDRNAEKVGYKAAELLDLKMNHRKIPQTPIVIQPKGVVVRRSTDITVIDDLDLAEALSFIRESAVLGIGIDDVADHVNLSRSTLRRLFLKNLKRSPKAEIMRVRLDHAKYLLSQTNLSIRSIAVQTGYKTVEHFAAMFKRHLHVTPMAYRNENQKFLTGK